MTPARRGMASAPKLLAAGLVAAVAGCTTLQAILGGEMVQITLVNAGSYDVEATVMVSSESETPDFLFGAADFVGLGEELNFTLAPGESVSFDRPCDELGSVFVSDAELNVLGNVGPETDSDVLRDGDDFNCGNHITFTFTHSALTTDFRVGSVVLPF